MAIKVNFIGYLTDDPKSRQVKDQTVYTFSVGARTTSKNAEGKYISNFYDCSMWGARGKYFAEHAKKGMRVFVSGDLAMVEYQTKNGETRNALRVTADSVEIAERIEFGTPNEMGTAPTQAKIKQPEPDANGLPF